MYKKAKGMADIQDKGYCWRWEEKKRDTKIKLWVCRWAYEWLLVVSVFHNVISFYRLLIGHDRNFRRIEELGDLHLTSARLGCACDLGQVTLLWGA